MIVTLVFTRRINFKDKENTYGTMVHFTKASITRVFDKGLADGNRRDRAAIPT